ncbi:hypothetical protein BaRGS_00024200 [Batillaria attramentaria]|uniref:Olfactomedin-like domain-containing protein n=1 Tax=Batillaria attramentaria TaxID=370345 RepID=A0ABD0KBT5_9CAEN|nr:hypothetical protein BaRGS_026748 [Batillaria attramentaria]
MIGKPYFKRNSLHQQGAWMRDAEPPRGVSGSKLWIAFDSKGTELFEFTDEDSMIANDTSITFDLSQMRYEGTGHVVYQNSLYYSYPESWKIVKYDITERDVTAVRYLHHRDAKFYRREQLYSSTPGVADFAVDETGLWVIYANHQDPAFTDDDFGLGPRDPNDAEDVFYLAKIEPRFMEPLKKFKLRLPRIHRGNGFMVCGSLYMVRNTDSLRTNIRYAFDAYTEEVKTPKIRFTNPYGNTSYLAYDPRKREILGWDSKNLVMYPLLIDNNPL